MEEKVSNHPCHRLSIPSAKLFWCRHCMQSFEDPINRWRHSKTCKTGGPSNHDKRLEQEPFALQTYCETKQREDANQYQVIDSNTDEPVMIIKQETVDSESRAEYSCFICKRPFSCLEDMKEHVKYPCSKNDPYNYPVYIPGSGGTYVEAPLNCFPNSSRKNQTVHPSAHNVITRRPVLGEIIEQSADPDTGIRTFEVHSQNDDIPLSDILSKLSEGGYLVAGEEESQVNQVVVVQQVDDQGQITQTEHILPPHIQIQTTTTKADVMEDITEDLEEQVEGEVTYYVSETGELTNELFVPVPIKQEVKPELYYNNYDDQLSGMNILTQAAEATIGNLIYPEKRKNEEEEEEEENVKRSRNQCKPNDDTSEHQPPHSPRSPRQPDGAAWNGGSVGSMGSVIEIKTEKCDSGNGSENGKQQNSNSEVKENTKERKSESTKDKICKKNTRQCSEEFKCRICDKTFKTIQLLNRHSQYPCKVFNTRNMCQKILRPKRGMNAKGIELKKTSSKHRVPAANQKSNAKIYRKPMLLLNSLRVFSTLPTDRKSKPKIKKKIVYIPTPTRVKKIWLPKKESLLVQELPEKEQFLYEFGLVSRKHLIENAEFIESDISGIVHPENLEKLENVFTPLMISTNVDCLRNSEFVNQMNFSPPILERMDTDCSLDEQEFHEEPPLLIPVLDVPDKRNNPPENIDTIEPGLKSNDEVEEWLKSFTTKSAEKRHFMDLFIEASPSMAQKQEFQDRSENERQAENKVKTLIKKEFISKLTNDLKKKLSTQKISDLAKPQTASRSLLSSFTNNNTTSEAISNSLHAEKMNTQTKNNLPTSVSKDNLVSDKPQEAPMAAEIVKSSKFGQASSSSDHKTKKLVLSISNKPGNRNSPIKINIRIYKQKAQIVQNSYPSDMEFECDHGLDEDDICEILDGLLTNISNNTDIQNADLHNIKSHSNHCEIVQGCLDLNADDHCSSNEISEVETTTKDCGSGLCLEHDNKATLMVAVRKNNLKPCVNDNNTKLCDENNVDSFVGDRSHERLTSYQGETSTIQKQNTQTRKDVPELLSLLVNKNQIDLLSMEENMNSEWKLCTLPQFLVDEGIVSDITDAKDEERTEVWDKDYLSSTQLTKPNVTVQYIKQVDSSYALTSDRLNYVADEYDINRSDGPDHSPDYQVNNISLREEEIVLSDSGLDDSDELLSQDSLVCDNCRHTVQC